MTNVLAEAQHTIINRVLNFVDELRQYLDEDQPIVSLTFCDMLYDIIYMGLRNSSEGGPIIENGTAQFTMHHGGGSLEIRRENPYPKEELIAIDPTTIDV